MFKFNTSLHYSLVNCTFHYSQQKSINQVKCSSLLAWPLMSYTFFIVQCVHCINLHCSHAAIYVIYSDVSFAFGRKHWAIMSRAGKSMIYQLKKSQNCVKAAIAFACNNCNWQLLYAAIANYNFCMHCCNWQLLFVLLQVTTIVSTIALCMYTSSSHFL